MPYFLLFVPLRFPDDVSVMFQMYSVQTISWISTTTRGLHTRKTPSRMASEHNNQPALELTRFHEVNHVWQII